MDFRQIRALLEGTGKTFYNDYREGYIQFESPVDEKVFKDYLVSLADGINETGEYVVLDKKVPAGTLEAFLNADIPDDEIEDVLMKMDERLIPYYVDLSHVKKDGESVVDDNENVALTFELPDGNFYAFESMEDQGYLEDLFNQLGMDYKIGTINLEDDITLVPADTLLSFDITPDNDRAEYDWEQVSKLIGKYLNKVVVREHLSKKDASAGEYIRDFEKSKNWRFKGDDIEKRKERAVAAYMQSRGRDKN